MAPPAGWDQHAVNTVENNTKAVDGVVDAEFLYNNSGEMWFEGQTASSGTIFVD